MKKKKQTEDRYIQGARNQAILDADSMRKVRAEERTKTINETISYLIRIIPLYPRIYDNPQMTWDKAMENWKKSLEKAREKLLQK